MSTSLTLENPFVSTQSTYYTYDVVGVVSIGGLTAFHVVLVPMEYIPSESPHSAYVIVSFCTWQKGSTF